MRLVILDPRDNVATAADDLHVGGTATVGDVSVEIRDDVPRGHKIALQPISIGANVIRYGEVIGSATADVAIGQHVHVHNLISKRLPGNRTMSTLRGFPRPAGKPGARNYVFVVPSVVCSTLLSQEIADATGAVTVSHQHGCGHIGPDITQARNLFAGLSTNPNVAHSLVMSLGCETVQGKQIAAELERRGYPTRLISIQDSGGYDAALDIGTREAQSLTAAIEDAQRAQFRFDELTLGITVSRLDPRLGDLVGSALSTGARVVIASDQDLSSALPHEPAVVGVGEPVAAPLTVVRNAGAGAQLLASTASCGAQVLIDFPAPNQPPHGFPLVPVLSVASDEGLHTMIADDFDLGADADAQTILSRAVEVFCGEQSEAEIRGSSTFAIPRLLRTM